MDGNFVADVRLEDSDEVLQLPIVKSRVKKLLQGAVKKVALLGAPVIPSSDDSLEQFLQAVGRFFGKDPAKWDQVGDTKVESVEEGTKRTVKMTGVFTGTELHLWAEQPHYDERLPLRDDKPDLNFNEKRLVIKTDAEWQELISDQPWTPSKRRQMLAAYLNAKLEADDAELAVEGAHGFWELAINREHHPDVRLDRLASLLGKLSSSNIAVATTTAAAIWGLATTGISRKSLCELDVVTLVLSNIKRTLKMSVVPDPAPLAPGEDPAVPPEGSVYDSARNRYQTFLLGALSVLLVDRNCRRPYLLQEPDYATLFTMCKNLEGYDPAAAAHRREAAAKLLTSMVQRDADARRHLIINGCLKQVLGLLNPRGPGETMTQFCMASLLATLVLDDDAMALIKERNEAPIMFEACLVLLSSVMAQLKREVAKFIRKFIAENGEGMSREQLAAAHIAATAAEEGAAPEPEGPGPEESDNPPPPYDVELGVRLAEAAAQAMWGSAHYCVLMDPIQVKMSQVEQLGRLGMDCYQTVQLPLSRVCHCVTATLATLSASPDAATLIMTCPNDVALNMLMAMLEVVQTENFDQAGHVKASACAGVAFLACHPIGAEGEKSMNGPFREKLLSVNAFGALLRAALSSVMEPECYQIIQQAAAIGAMYLSTMAGAVDAAELSMYAALLTDSDNSEMIEFLMAGMWILLRNPENRKVLGTSFSPNPANALAKNMMSKLNDAIMLHEVNDTVNEKVRAINRMQAGPEDEEAAAAGESQQGSVSGMATPAKAASRAQTPMQGGSVSIAAEAGQVVQDAGAPQGEDEQSQGDGQAAKGEGAGQAEGAEAASGEGGESPPDGGGGDQAEEEQVAEGEQPADAPEGEGGESRDLVAEAMGPEPDESALEERRQSGAGAGALPESVKALYAADVYCPEPVSMPDGGTFYGAKGPFGNTMLLKRNEVKKPVPNDELKGKVAALEKRFDKQLKDNWGLETLVSVGESWMPAMQEQDELGEANDVPVLKLFEFLVASVCMFMVDDDGSPEVRELDVFRLSAPAGAKNKTWWTVDAKAPEPLGNVDTNTERALKIMLQILGMRLHAAWKSLQLGVLTLWNAAARNPSMERHVVERGAAVKLLMIINNPQWPPSLREIAAGCLEFLQERYSNMTLFGLAVLPEGSTYSLSSPPAQGIVPYVAAMVGLINSRVPLMEYRGCHGLARITFIAPYASPDAKAFLQEAKATAAALGGIDVLVALIKRLNKRYQDLLNGRSFGSAMPRTNQQRREDESMVFERDMSSLDAQQDVYFVALAALLNISVLKSNQVAVAKKGLLTLLGTNTLLFNRVAAQRSKLSRGVAVASEMLEREIELLYICSSILQNISLHPQNRTRLYKAELQGSAALDKVIETPQDADEQLRSSAAFLPPIKGHTSASYGSPSASSSSPSRGTKLAGTGRIIPKTSANGAILNHSVDTALAATIRPKCAFPPLVDRDGPGHSYPGGLLGSPRPPYSPGVRGSTAETHRHGPASPGGGNDGHEGMSHEALTNARYRFLAWIDNTFADMESAGNGGMSLFGGASGKGVGADKQKRTYRKQMWDKKGDWIGNEPETAKALHRMLCRPLTHLWQDTPENRGRHGKARWTPTVSEYREAGHEKPLTRSAAKLLSTQPPTDEELLQVMASELTSTGLIKTLDDYESDFDEDEDIAFLAAQASTQAASELTAAGAGGADAHSHATTGKSYRLKRERPATSSRRRGEVGLTVLHSRPEIAAASTLRSLAEGHEGEEGEGGDSANPSPRGGPSPQRSGLHAMSGADGVGASGRGSPAPGQTAAGQVPLKVCLGPQRTRQVITFEDRIIIDNDASRPTLTVFEHVEGSRVSDGLYPSYVLPNGKRAHMYYSGGALLDEVAVEAVVPPPRPSTVPQALQQTMPLANVLNLIAKPPGSSPPFIPYKPVPRLVPLPEKHTLTVKRPDLRSGDAYGDLREDNLQLVVQAKKIIKTQTTTRVENIEVKAPEEREPWTLPMSVFKPRAKESDAKGYLDTDVSEEKMFERDWQRACSKEKFTGMLARENKANKDGKPDGQALKEVHDVLLKSYAQLFGAFVYYAAGGSGDPYHMSLNAFTTFLDECEIADHESQFVKRSDCDTVFIVCNFQPDKKSAEAQVNLENAMMRYEFIEAIVRLALAKYGKGQATDDIAVAVDMLLSKNMLPKLPPGAYLNPNNFRNDRLYNEEVDLVFKKHQALLKLLYSRYRLKPTGGGLRPKVLKLDGWQQLMNDAHLVDSQFTLTDATLSFLWARMYVIDEIKDYAKYSCLSFVDFLEALARAADVKSLPTSSDLDMAGYDNVMDWAMDKERQETGMGRTEGEAAEGGGASGDGGDEGGGGGGGGGGGHHESGIFAIRASAGYATVKNRPLYIKLELFLDLMFRRLYWDPSQADSTFNYDNLVKMIKKADKDMGP